MSLLRASHTFRAGSRKGTTLTKKESTEERNERVAAVVKDSIGRKLKENHVKVASLIAHCEELDVNGDNIIHISDLQEVLISQLGRGGVSQREMHHLAWMLKARAGSINYMRFLDLFCDFLEADDRKETKERWLEDSDGNFADSRDKSWATRRGSVGEWLDKAACPSEVRNFRRFIACLEEYERSSGMKCIHKEDGFLVPLGPDLKASISFFMR